MKEQAVKLKQVENELSNTKGPFELFGLFLREDASNKWDLLISADWARGKKKESINLIVQEIKKVLSNQEMLMLSRIVILDKDDAAMKTIHSAMHVEHGLAEISDSNFYGMDIKHAYLITSQHAIHNKANA